MDGAEGTWGDIPERTKVQKAAVSSNNSALGDFSPCDWIFNPWDCDFSLRDCRARHRGGGEKRSTQTGKDEAEGFERFENQTLQPLLL